MSQVSKVGLELTMLADDVIELAYDGGGDNIAVPIREHKQELLTIILEALPEKEHPSYGDGWDKWSEGHMEGFNAAISNVKEALNRVFGVEE